MLIPQAVFNELVMEEQFQQEADQIRRRHFIIVKAVQNPESANLLKRASGLDQRGERSRCTDG